MVTLSCPTARWYPLRPHAGQAKLWTSSSRFRVAACGRRSGKSELAKRFGAKLAIAPQRYQDARYVFGGPTYAQAKRVFWPDLKKLVPRWALLGQDPRRAVSEDELTIQLANGSTIQVVGLDRPERAEGVAIDFALIDEAANVREEAWTEHLRPGLSERGGQAWIISTPEGRNWLWQLAQRAQEDTTGLWSYHTWPSSTILDPVEIAIAKAELDQRTFAQEYDASFLDVSGRVYYNFRREVHAAESLPYDPFATLLVSFDFNVSPGVAVFAQVRRYRGDNLLVDRVDPIAVVTDELWIERDSNTPRVCQEIVRRYRDHHGPVEVYADATGGAKGTSQTDGSDLVLIRKHLEPVFGERLNWHVPHANPPVRARINSLNSRLESADGKVHLLVDPSCKHVVQDLEGVTWSPSGDIDKKSSPMLSHISDALGYLTHGKWPLSGYGSVVEQM